ncbi:hypothetical protein PCASD_14317 [Puccinia coronata f. sp. avenae]|uniref:CxC1-like cysteine cluster associated with KDZ transposases domain-containing protein n=1 Tax=Puccinia coronata f. sp. avenae TaxID=200324 RepID=A0A2N5U9K1_9BASI|nr:hypothetical protein PCASD_14317 [Puccinia coronata f. sp. avenae]
MYTPVGNRTERLRRRLNAAEDIAAMYRLERSMAFAAENQRAQHVQPPDIESRNNTFEQDGENYNLQPGLEDNQEDEDFETLDTWVTLEREESPDAINSMIQASNEYYRQRAKERNFNRLFNDLHPVYLIQKNKTSNWASSSTYIDFSPPCKYQTRRNRVVDLIDLYGQRRKRVDFCDCTLDGVRLMYLGYVAGSPVEPQTAFSLPLLIFHNHLWNHCNIGALPFTQALCLFLEPQSERLHVRNGQHGDGVGRSANPGSGLLPCLFWSPTTQYFGVPTLPENLARMAASEFILDAAIQFKLGRAPPSESLTDSNSVAKRPGR